MSNPVVEAEASDDKIWVLVAYIFAPWVSLFMLIFMKNQEISPFLKYHSTQALAWGFTWLILTALGVGICLFPVILIYSIYLGFRAYRGEATEIPLLTAFLRSQGWI